MKHGLAVLLCILKYRDQADWSNNVLRKEGRNIGQEQSGANPASSKPGWMEEMDWSILAFIWTLTFLPRLWACFVLPWRCGVK